MDAAGIQGVDRLIADLPAVTGHVRRLRDRFTAGPIRKTQQEEHSISGRVRFVDEHTLEINGETIHTDATVIATGTRPVLPSSWRAGRDFG